MAANYGMNAPAVKNRTYAKKKANQSNPKPMPQILTITGRVISFTRLKSSKMGNPRYKIRITNLRENIVGKTPTDSMWVYALTNLTLKRVRATYTEKGKNIIFRSIEIL